MFEFEVNLVNVNSMRYILKNTVRMLFLLFAVCLGAYVLVSLSPLDPIQSYIGTDSAIISEEQVNKIIEYWGLNLPAHERFINWFKNVLHGDFGISMLYRRPVLDVLKEKFVASIALMLSAWLISGVLGFILGIISGMNKGKLIDRIIKWFTLLLASTPTFWFGLVMLMIFSVKLKWFPLGLGVPVGVSKEYVSLSDYVSHMILPAFTLGITGVANIAQHTREKLIDVLESDYILYACSRGESNLTILFRHGIRNIMVPAIMLQFASFSELFGGSMLAEQVFSYPGLGQAVVAAGIKGDVSLLLGITLFSSIFVFTGNFIANMIYGLIDPQVKEGKANE